MMRSSQNIFVVIPALNEAKRISGVLNELIDLDFKNIVVVDDGSNDNTFKIASQFKNVTALRHDINLGPGASTMTGIEYALSKQARIIAMLDADHQHHPKDLLTLIEELEHNETVDMVIGSRFLQNNSIPKTRKFYNWVGNWVSYLKTGVFISDSQSGMKVISRKFAEKLTIDYNGFEFCIDIIKKARLTHQNISEKPINVTYTVDTMSKGQSLQNGLMMLGRLLNPF